MENIVLLNNNGNSGVAETKNCVQIREISNVLRDMMYLSSCLNLNNVTIIIQHFVTHKFSGWHIFERPGLRLFVETLEA